MKEHPLKIIILHTVLLLAGIVALIPLVWLLCAAFRDQSVFNTYAFVPPVSDINSNTINTDNFARLMEQTEFMRLLVNSIFVTCTSVLIQLVLAALGGWALANYQFRGRQAVVGLMVATMMIPGAVLLAPNYELIYRFGLMDSHLGLIIPGAVSVFGMFLFRQSMRSIPRDLVHSARIDGCGEWGIFWRIALPLSRPMISAFCLISFMGTWNSFLWPQIILQSNDLFTLPIGLNQLVGLYKEDNGALMAGTLLAILPVVLLFFALQREFIAGLTRGAVKG